MLPVAPCSRCSTGCRARGSSAGAPTQTILVVCLRSRNVHRKRQWHWSPSDMIANIAVNVRTAPTSSDDVAGCGLDRDTSQAKPSKASEVPTATAMDTPNADLDARMHTSRACGDASPRLGSTIRSIRANKLLYGLSGRTYKKASATRGPLPVGT